MCDVCAGTPESTSTATEPAHTHAPLNSGLNDSVVRVMSSPSDSMRTFLRAPDDVGAIVDYESRVGSDEWKPFERHATDPSLVYAQPPHPQECIDFRPSEGELKKIYTAPTEQAAFDALAEFSSSEWGRKYPQAVKVWEDAWDTFIPYLAFTPPVRKLLYTTNGIESLNYQLRKVTKARGHFPGDDAVVKLWLAIINIEDKRARERAAKREKGTKHAFAPTRLVEGQRASGWREALNELSIAYPGRIR